MKKIRLLVLGTGGMAAAHIKQFQADPRVDVTGCSDIDLALEPKIITSSTVSVLLNIPAKE